MTPDTNTPEAPAPDERASFERALGIQWPFADRRPEGSYVSPEVDAQWHAWQARAALAAAPKAEPSVQSGWIAVKDRLPALHEAVALINADAWENCPDGMDRNVQAAGYREQMGSVEFWSIRGQRSTTIDAFTHWFALPSLTAAPSTPAPQGEPARHAPLLDAFLADAERHGITHLRVPVAESRAPQVAAGATPAPSVLTSVESVVTEARINGRVQIVMQRVEAMCEAWGHGDASSVGNATERVEDALSDLVAEVRATPAQQEKQQ